MTKNSHTGSSGPVTPPDVSAESDDAAPASMPVADAHGVRFSVFFEIHGPRVFSIDAGVLMTRFGAASRQPDDLLQAFRLHEAQIVAAAQRHKTQRGGVTPLPDAEFAQAATR